MDTINISGITYFNLQEEYLYSGDTSKGCGLTSKEIDNNFNTLRGHDIATVAFINNKLVLTRLNGSEIHVDINQTPEITEENLSFSYDKINGNLTITYPNGNISIISGFSSTSTEIYTDGTINGDGTINNPLRINNIEKTGFYAPADKYFELSQGETLNDALSGKTPLPEYRIVTKEITDTFGKLYSPEGLVILSNYLTENNSEWRIPSKKDWDLLLNALEIPEFKNHSASTYDFLGRDAAQPLKSDYFWKYNENEIIYDCTCGFDIHGFDIMPVGEVNDNSTILSGIGEISGFWTSSKNENNEYTYIKEFVYDSNKVKQNGVNEGFYSIRLVKDYNGSNYHGIEGIFNQNYPTLLIPELKQIWTTINVYATKKHIHELTRNVNFIDADSESVEFDSISNSFYINEWNGNEWIKTELKEGNSIIIKIKDENNDDYYRRWTVKNGELRSFEDYATGQINSIIDNLNDFIDNRLEGIVKDTVKSYLESTTNEIDIKEKDGKLKISFSDDAIFG